MRIAGHSHSPLFRDETNEDAGALLKAGAIDAEMYARMINTPNLNAIIHSLRKRRKQQQQMVQQHPELLMHQGGKKHK